MVFDSSSLPEVVFQDDPAFQESSFDASSLRLQVNLTGSTDGLNRTLLKFTNNNQVWYQAIYTQAEGRSGYVEPDQGAAINTTATVGARIERPSDRYSLAGPSPAATSTRPRPTWIPTAWVWKLPKKGPSFR